MVKLRLDRCNIREDVGMVEFKVVEYRGPRAVMHELAAFVEKCRIVFISFDHEGVAGSGTRGDTKILWNTANQEPRGQPGVFKNPGEHRTGRGLAMCARNSQHMAPVEQVLTNPLRTRNIRKAALQHLFHQRVAA